jgi:anion-transporting  ArsA/GET3 family ATPase
VLVTSPNPLIIQEALFFHRALREDGIRTAAVVVNRVQRDPRRHGGPDNVAALKEALQLAQIKNENRLGERLCDTLSEQAILADLDRREIDRLRSTLVHVPLFTVPRLRRDVHDLAGLWQIGEYLGGD